MALRIETRTMYDDVDIICNALVKEIMNAHTLAAKLDAANAILHIRKLNEKINGERISLLEASLRSRLDNEREMKEPSMNKVAGTGRVEKIKTLEDLYYGKR